MACVLVQYYSVCICDFTLYMYKVLIKINFRDRIELHSCSTTYGDSIFTKQDVKL